MHRFRRLTLALAGALAATLTQPAAAAAQHATEPHAAEQHATDRSDWEVQVRAYRLTMDKVTRTAKANDLLYAMLKKDPSLAKRWEDQGSPLDNSKTVDEAARRLDADPAAHRALGGAGISGRDYALTLMAYIQASLTAGLQDSKQLTKVPEGVPPENIAFVRAHRAELAKLKGSFNPERDPAADDDGDAPK